MQTCVGAMTVHVLHQSTADFLQQRYKSLCVTALHLHHQRVAGNYLEKVLALDATATAEAVSC